MQSRSGIVASPAGGVLATSLDNPNTSSVTELQQFTATGAAGWSLPRVSSQQLEFEPVFDGLHHAYFSEVRGADDSYAIAAVDTTGSVLWRKALPTGWVLYRLIVGLDGDIYALESAGCCEESLVRLSRVDGSTKFSVPIPSAITGSVTEIFAYSGGVIVAGGAVDYISGQGTILYQYALPAGSIWPVFAVSATGDLFTGNLPDGPGGNCSYGTGSISVAKYTPSGQQWVYRTPASFHCYTGFSLSALPSGGVIGTFNVDGSDDLGITVVNRDGGLAWSAVPQSAVSGAFVGDIRTTKVDENGNIAVLEEMGLPCRNSSEVCAGIQIEVLSQTTGASTAATQDFYQPDPDPGVYQRGGEADSLAVASGQVYVSLEHYDGTPLTSNGVTDHVLTALAIPGIGRQYPDAALWDQMPQATSPASTYAALGDSYSSGEGDGTYQWDSFRLSPVNNCHRSPKAYAALLSKSNAAVTDFVFSACSGAITDDFYQSNHEGNYLASSELEPAQISDIPTDARYVTLTIGGNDAGFAYALNTCVYGKDRYGILRYGKPGCASNKSLVSGTISRIDALAGKGSATVVTDSGVDTKVKIHALHTLLADIHRRAPKANIFIADYPLLFSPTFSKSNCQVGTMSIVNAPPAFGTINMFATRTDIDWLNSMAYRMDNRIHSEVTVARSAGVPVTVVGVLHRWDGHGLCDTKTPWIQRLSGSYDNSTHGTAIYSGSFHPTITGQQAGYEAAFLSDGMP
jgi:lysophospholipase L1-like esterase